MQDEVRGAPLPHVLNYHDFKRAGLPPGAVYFGRANPAYGLPKSKRANPFKLRRKATDGERAEAIRG
jgi:hypothetical protein